MALSATVTLIQKRNLHHVDNETDHFLTEAMHTLSHVRLDREKITKIENLELLTSVTNLYLQHNLIETIENLACLSSTLRFLTLAGNNISIVQGLKSLGNLGFLDLGDNLIDDFDVQELPKNLSFVLFRNNGCTNLPDYRDRLIQNLPSLKSIDDELIGEDDEDISESESDDEDLVEESNNDKDVADVCSDVLDRTSSRLEMIIKDHCKKIMDIEDEPHTAQSTKNEKIHSDMDDTKLHQIEETMKNFLDEVVEAERIALNSFELPNLNLQTYLPSSSCTKCSLRMMFDDEEVCKENKESISSERISDDGRLPSKQPSYVSVGTTSGLTATPPTKERTLRPRLKTKLSSKTTSDMSRTRTKQAVGNEPIIKDLKVAPKSLKSISSNSLVRIPGARPFLKS